MNALRLSTDVSRAPQESIYHGCTMDSVRICTANAEAGSLSLDSLVCLFIYLWNVVRIIIIIIIIILVLL